MEFYSNNPRRATGEITPARTGQTFPARPQFTVFADLTPISGCPDLNAGGAR